MSINNQKSRTLGGINDLSIDQLNLPSHDSSIVIDGNEGTTNQFIRKNGINDLVYGGITLSDISFDGDIIPSSNKTFDLGSNSKKFAVLNIDKIDGFETTGSIVPDGNNQQDIGDTNLKFENLYVKDAHTTTLSTTTTTTTNLGAHAQTGNITMSSTHNIGTGEARAGTIFSTALNSNLLSCATILISTIIVPTQNNTQSLGNPELYFANAYMTNTHTNSLTMGGDITMAGNDINGGGAINTTTLTATNLGAHAQTGNITMSGLHNIGIAEARAGTIFTTTLNTTNLTLGSSFNPSSIGAFSLTGAITCAEAGLTIGVAGDHPVANIKSVDMTLTTKLTTAQISGFQLDGNINTNINTAGGATGYDIGTNTNRIQNLYVETLIPRSISNYELAGAITMSSTHDIGTGGNQAGTIHTQQINSQEHPNLSIHTKDLIVRNSANSQDIFKSSGSSTSFYNAAGSHEVVKIDPEELIVKAHAHDKLLFAAGDDNIRIFTNTAEAEGKSHKKVIDINSGLIKIFAHDQSTTPIMTINTNLNLGAAGQINFHNIQNGGAGEGGEAVGDMYRDNNGFLKVRLSG